VLDYCGGTCDLEPFARKTLGVIYDTWGEPDDALAQYDLALKIFVQRGDKPAEVVETLNNIGMVYAINGDAAAALDKFQEALNERSQSAANREDVTHSNLGYAYMLMGVYPAALRELDQAQQLSQRFENPRFRAYSFLRLGMTHVARFVHDPSLVQAMDQAI